MPTNETTEVKLAWTPPERPEWVNRANEEGAYYSLKSMIPLRAEELIETAKIKTGLSDFGNGSWREPLEIICNAADEEAELHMMGRIMLRTELLLALEGRLQIEEIYKQHPEIEDEVIEKPLFIIGQGRSGTSVLYNTLNQDPANGALLTWEAMMPCPPPEEASYESDPRIEYIDKLAMQRTRVVPEFAAVHEHGGHMPCECIEMMIFSFTSIWYMTLAQMPSYAAYLAAADWNEAYSYHKRTLKVLQWKKPRRWLLKSPVHLHHLPNLLNIYPDACLIWPHRDPVRTLASSINTTKLSNYSSSDNHDISNFEQFTTPEFIKLILEAPIDLLDSGAMSSDRLCNVQYNDIIDDPVKVVESIYNHFDIQYTEENLAPIRKYFVDNPRKARPEYSYKLSDDHVVAEQRALFKRYQDFFNIPNEE